MSTPAGRVAEGPGSRQVVVFCMLNGRVNYVQIMCILNVYWNAQLCVNHMPFYVFNERAHYVQILCMLHVE